MRRRAGRSTVWPLATLFARAGALAALRPVFRLGFSRRGLRHQDGGGRAADIVGVRRICGPLPEGQRGGRQHDETQLDHVVSFSRSLMRDVLHRATLR
jgi:hypothetical protein